MHADVVDQSQMSIVISKASLNLKVLVWLQFDAEKIYTSNGYAGAFR